MCSSSLLQFARDFQSLIVGVIGFGGVILTLNRNAANVRSQQKSQNAHDADVLRRALSAELAGVRNTLQFNIEAIDKVKDAAEGIFVPERPMVHIYTELLAKIGLLSQNEIGVVMEAYALIAQLNERTALFASHPQPATPNGFFFVPNEALQHVRKLQSGYLDKIDRAITAMLRADASK